MRSDTKRTRAGRSACAVHAQTSMRICDRTLSRAYGTPLLLVLPSGDLRFNYMWYPSRVSVAVAVDATSQRERECPCKRATCEADLGSVICCSSPISSTPWSRPCIYHTTACLRCISFASHSTRPPTSTLLLSCPLHLVNSPRVVPAHHQSLSRCIVLSSRQRAGRRRRDGCCRTPDLQEPHRSIPDFPSLQYRRVFPSWSWLAQKLDCACSAPGPACDFECTFCLQTARTHARASTQPVAYRISR